MKRENKIKSTVNDLDKIYLAAIAPLANFSQIK